MTDKNKKSYRNPTVVLQDAIEELESFTKSEASRLEVGEDGRLVAAKETRLERVVGLARSYIIPIFSDQVRQAQQRKLSKIKQAILQARDIIQSHSALIEKFKEGDDSQQKLASYALEAIQRYNAIVAQDPSDDKTKFDVYNYERHHLLLDDEIKGLQIELPDAVSIKYDSHPAHPAQERLKELSNTLLLGAAKKQFSTFNPIHKKTDQFMIDTFRMKSIRMIQTHLTQQNTMAEVVQLVNQTPIELDEESDPSIIIMRQLLEIGPGSHILLTGSFKRNPSDPKFMRMPILDSFRLSSQLTHSGFPYPSQYTGWALADKWVEAYPLRIDQIPLFQKIDQRKKKFAHQLLHSQEVIQKARARYRVKRAIFDEHRSVFIPLHRQLQEGLREGCQLEESDIIPIFDAYYNAAMEAPSAFDVLVQTQQQLLDFFVRNPLKALEDEWLETEATPLRMGSPQERLQAACFRFQREREKAIEYLDPQDIKEAFIEEQGNLLGSAFQAIALQYLSEKMVFPPPLLNDFERKLQICAFQQLHDFLEECENRLEIIDPKQIEEEMLNLWMKDLRLIQSSNVDEEDHIAVALADELEVYFNSRYYAIYPRR